MENLRNSFSVSFFLRTDRVQKNNMLPIYITASLNRRRIKVSTKFTIEANRWNSKLNWVKGNSKEIKELANELDDLKRKLKNCYLELCYAKAPFTIEDVKIAFLGNKEHEYTLISIFNYHKEKEQERLSSGTIKNFNSTQKIFQEYLSEYLRVKDIPLYKLNYKFITEFEFYVLERNKDGLYPSCSHNTIMRHIVRMRKVVNLAIKNDWLEKDPFKKFQVSYKKSKREFLSQEDLEKIEERRFDTDRLNQVRDLFIFSCYTGLSYIDMISLTQDNISVGIDNEIWIRCLRKKTQQAFNVPLLPQALNIIRKYQFNPIVMNSGKLLPNISNQKLNA